MAALEGIGEVGEGEGGEGREIGEDGGTGEGVADGGERVALPEGTRKENSEVFVGAESSGLHSSGGGDAVWVVIL